MAAELEREMELAARNLQFERAAALRDQAAELRKKGVKALAGAQPKRERGTRYPAGAEGGTRYREGIAGGPPRGKGRWRKRA